MTMKKDERPGECLVYTAGDWFIARLGHAKKSGAIDAPDEVCWVERDGSVICWVGEEDALRPLPVP